MNALAHEEVWGENKKIHSGANVKQLERDTPRAMSTNWLVRCWRRREKKEKKEEEAHDEKEEEAPLAGAVRPPGKSEKPKLHQAARRSPLAVNLMYETIIEYVTKQKSATQIAV